MKNYSKELTSGALLATIVLGLLFWFTRYESDSYLKIGIATIAIFVGGYVYIRQIISKNRDIKEGLPPEDEFTERAKLYAGSRAFLYSMGLWFLIFIFRTSFPDQEEMLGIGIMGSALIYGIALWYYKTTGAFDEK